MLASAPHSASYNGILTSLALFWRHVFRMYVEIATWNLLPVFI